MVTIHNSDLFKELREGLKSQQLRDGILPNQLAEKVVPVMEVNPKLLRRTKVLVTLERTTTTGASPGTTILTTNPGKDTFLTGISFSVASDATADNTQIRVRIQDENNITGYIISLNKITLTASRDTVHYTFPIPIKLFRGSVVTYLNVFTVGVSTSQMTLWGYELDNPLA